MPIRRGEEIAYGGKILEHFRRPRNSGGLDAADVVREADNPLCGDRVRIGIRVRGGVVVDVRFRAEACAICVAAASLLTEIARGLTVEAAASLPDESIFGALETEIRAERRRCATLPLEALRSAANAVAEFTRNQEGGTMPEPRDRGRFCWYDLLTTNPDAAIPFYKRVIGWDTQKWEGGGGTYTMWTNGGAPLGGVMAIPEQARASGSPPHWLAYIATPDIQATVSRAKELGAGVHVPPTDIPTVGKYAVLTDPQGAAFAVFQPATDTPGHDGAPAIGEFSWHELATTDPEAAFRFYSDLFGWTKTDAMDMGPGGIYQMYGRNGVPLGGMYRKPDEIPVPCWLYYTMIDDVHSGAERVRAAGGQVVNGPMEVPGGDWIAQCTDPQGAMFALHSVKK
jgi:hypothetical protein